VGFSEDTVLDIFISKVYLDFFYLINDITCLSGLLIYKKQLQLKSMKTEMFGDGMKFAGRYEQLIRLAIMDDYLKCVGCVPHHVSDSVCL
jgi:hypothetical protein